MSTWGEAYIEHFESFLGELSSREVFDNELMPRSMQVLRYDDEAADTTAFCSFGLSHYGPQVGGVAEVYCPVDRDLEFVPKVLAIALFFAVSKGIGLEPGTNIGGLHAASAEMFQSCGKTAILFTAPTEVPDAFASVQRQGEEGRVLMANFVSQSEATFLRANGADALLDALAEADAQLSDLHRRSIL